MKTRIYKEIFFEATHRLIHYQGKCFRLHGHQWRVEGWIEGTTGWAIGPGPDAPVSEAERRARELQDLYSKLEYLIIPTYYLRKDEWATIKRSSIAKIAYYFNTHRMMRRYATEAYL